MTPENRPPVQPNDDATLAPPKQSEQNTSPGTSDPTLVQAAQDAPPLAGPSDPTLGGKSDRTLPPSAAATSAAGDTSRGVHSDATLPPPPGKPLPDTTVAFQRPTFEPDATLPPPTGDARLGMTVPLMKAAASPSDATLNPGDQQAKDFHTAALQKSSSVDGAGKHAVTTGASFGHYELLAPIAKGGMGIVYKARQRNLNRIVAIKMILSGQFADQTDVDRFYAEAEAAAALSHPNIVAIHEIGEVQGQHFFSMDFVDGQSLAQLVQESPLPPRRGAELVGIIAETMQFAHDKGIVHRDLKPGNVLLDKKQRPLITDFGLAKHVSNTSQMTMAGAVVGTPSYMPPEQASGKGDEVGPWSDLYSLGAILYECLTGRPPFRAANPFETIRQVINTEPLSPRLLNPSVPPDLETICLKCLQKDRHQRYGSAQELADELGRFLKGEPILARPITKVERFWRLCKRNPVTSGAFALAFVFLLAASVVSTLSYFNVSAALAKSDRYKRRAMSAVNQFFTRVSENKLLNEPGMQSLRNELLEDSRGYFEELLTEQTNDPEIQAELAGAYFRLGKTAELLQSIDDALPFYMKAGETQELLLSNKPDDPALLEGLGNTLVATGTIWVKKKDFEKARLDYGHAVRLRTQLVAIAPHNIEYQRLLANTYMNIGLAEKEAAIEEADDQKYNSGMAAARQQFEEAQKIRRAALEKDDTNANLRRDLAKGYYNLGTIDSEHAETHYRDAVREFELLDKGEQSQRFNRLDNQLLLATCYRLLGDILSTSKPTEARIFYQKSLDRMDPLSLQNPDVVSYQTERAVLLTNLFFLESAAGNGKAARTMLERARDIWAPLAKRFADEPNYRLELTVTLRELAGEQSRGGDSKSAIADWKAAIAILKELVGEYSQTPMYQRDLAMALRELVKEQDANGETEFVAENLREAIRLLDELVKKHPQEPEYSQQLEKTKAIMLAAGPR